MQIVTSSKNYLPTKIGKAVLHYEKCYIPTRDGKDIIIPSDDKEAVFLEHPDKPIFLFVSDNYDVFFGGTDERPFLVRLSTNKYNGIDWMRLWQNNKFEEELKPQALKGLLNIFKYKPKRQGDIWALPITTDDWQLFLTLSNIFNSSFAKEPEESDEYHVFGTRHILQGQYSILEEGLVAQGKLIAPDHKDLDISKNLHLVFQNDYLYNPREAD